MLFHVIDFLVDFVTNLNARKILGGILFLVGMGIIGMIGASGNPDKAVAYALGGIFVGGVGAVIVYYDIANDKVHGGHDELRTLTKGYQRKEFEERKPSAWHMNDHENPK